MIRLIVISTIGLLAAVVAVSPAPAQTFSSGSTGADGAFNPPTGTTTLALPRLRLKIGEPSVMTQSTMSGRRHATWRAMIPPRL